MQGTARSSSCASREMCCLGRFVGVVSLCSVPVTPLATGMPGVANCSIRSSRVASAIEGDGSGCGHSVPADLLGSLFLVGKPRSAALLLLLSPPHAIGAQVAATTVARGSRRERASRPGEGGVRTGNTCVEREGDPTGMIPEPRTPQGGHCTTRLLVGLGILIGSRRLISYFEGQPGWLEQERNEGGGGDGGP